jgi:hypothetical protein
MSIILDRNWPFILQVVKQPDIGWLGKKHRYDACIGCIGNIIKRFCARDVARARGPIFA